MASKIAVPWDFFICLVKKNFCWKFQFLWDQNMRFLEFLIISPILTLVTSQVNTTVTNSKASNTHWNTPAKTVSVLSIMILIISLWRLTLMVRSRWIMWFYHSRYSRGCQWWFGFQICRCSSWRMWIDIQGTILVFWWLRESFQPTGDCKRYHLFKY